MTFSLTARGSELGRQGLAGRPGAGRVMRYRATSTIYQLTQGFPAQELL